MKIERKWFLAAFLLLPLLLVFTVKADGDEPRYRWDIITVSFSPVTTINAGGSASALSNEGAKITVTGSGRFAPGDPDDVNGGGNWQTFDPGGTSTGSGTYEVKQLIGFTVAPGNQTNGVVDNIGNPADLTDFRAGLAYFRIKYFDNLGNPISGAGGKGILVVSCRLPGNTLADATPSSVFEGITASKGFIDYWNRVAPVGPGGNRTSFHVLPED